MRHRQLNLYFTAMSAVEALFLIFLGLKTHHTGNKGYGRCASHLESVWSSRFGGEEAVVFPSARSGLYVLLRALGIGRGDEVIITGFTCNAVPLPVLQCGAVPIYADIDPLTYAIDVVRVERLIGPRTKALVIQHTFGIPAAVQELVELARGRGLHVIEDACLALGSRFDGKPLGGFADAAVFSFELSKTISAGWGGLIQANVPQLGATLRSIRDEAGTLHRWEAVRRPCQAGLSYFLYHPRIFRATKYLLALLFKWRIFRYSASPEERQGCLPSDALASPVDGQWRVIERQLERLDGILDNSARIADRYTRILLSHGWQGCVSTAENRAARLIRFPILVQDKELMMSYFLEEGIELGSWFDAPVTGMPSDPSVFHYRPGQCPVAEEVSQQIVNFPLHSRLSTDDVNDICLVLDRYLIQNPEKGNIPQGLVSVTATL